MRYNRLPSVITEDDQFYDYITMSHYSEMSQLSYYKELAKRGCLKNIFLKVNYIYKKFFIEILQKL